MMHVLGDRLWQHFSSVMMVMLGLLLVTALEGSCSPELAALLMR